MASIPSSPRGRGHPLPPTPPHSRSPRRLFQEQVVRQRNSPAESSGSAGLFYRHVSAGQSQDHRYELPWLRAEDVRRFLRPRELCPPEELAADEFEHRSVYANLAWTNDQGHQLADSHIFFDAVVSDVPGDDVSGCCVEVLASVAQAVQVPSAGSSKSTVYTSLSAKVKWNPRAVSVVMTCPWTQPPLAT
jgi:hypothetical protein